MRTISPKTNIKLPKLSIKKFLRETSNWLDFWNNFETSIHKNDTITLLDKFSYLKSLTGGLALNSVSGLALTEENYRFAIDTLTERYLVEST